MQQAKDLAEFQRLLVEAIEFIRSDTGTVEALPAFLYGIIRQVFPDLRYLTCMHILPC